MNCYALGDEYYVVRDPATRKCRVVDQKPAVVADMVGRGPLKTWTEAKKGMKTSKVCALVIAPFRGRLHHVFRRRSDGTRNPALAHRAPIPVFLLLWAVLPAADFASKLRPIARRGTSARRAFS